MRTGRGNTNLREMPERGREAEDGLVVAVVQWEQRSGAVPDSGVVETRARVVGSGLRLARPARDVGTYSAVGSEW